MKHIFFWLFSAVLSTSCWAAENTLRYFPTNFDQSYYAAYLGAMNEPSLFERKEQKASEVYRFIWIRTFHTPIVVFAENLGTNRAIRISRFKRVQGLPTSRIEERTLSITEAQWLNLTNQIAKVGFWEMSSKPTKTGVDGAHWVLEGVRGRGYKVVDRWAPMEDERSERYVEVCLELLRLAKIDLSKEKVY